VINAKVTLTQTSTSAQRKTKTPGDGNFVLSALDPGTYSISVSAQGFKTSEKTGLNLTAAKRLSTGTIALQVSQISDSVTVRADVVVVQDGERGKVLRADHTTGG